VSASTHNIRLVVAAAVARGVPPSRLLTAIGLEPQALLAADGRIDAALALRSWSVAAELTGDPWFGLGILDHLGPDFLGGLGLALHSCATFGATLRMLARYFPVIHQHVELELVEIGAAARLRLSFAAAASPDELRHPVELLLAAMRTLGRRATGAELVPGAVAFRHAAPPTAGGASAPAYLRAFGVTPAFEQPCDELVFARTALEHANLAPDPGLAQVVGQRLERARATLPPRDSFVDRVRRLVLEELDLGEATLPRVAARLRMSERTLQRRLGAAETSLQAMVDDVRRTQSLRALAESGASIAEISYRLGFTEASAFHRAFKRWTGSTPASYRRAMAASGA
jgi:AraC-like DNA-binding protein